MRLQYMRDPRDPSVWIVRARYRQQTGYGVHAVRRLASWAAVQSVLWPDVAVLGAVWGVGA